MINRRQALRRLASLPLGATSVHLSASPATGTPRLLLVFLRGAYDAASLLVPVGNSFYYEQRPTIAIARPGSAADAALPLNADWALSPAWATNLLPLFQRGELAFVPFAGTHDSSRSHFETQDHIELGQPQGARRFESGFLNRLAAVLGHRDAIAFTAQPPLVMRGSVAIPNLALARLGKSALGDRQSALIADMYRGTALETPVRESFSVRDEARRQIRGGTGAGIAGEMLAASRDAITARGFEGEARRIARLMRERYALGFVDVGGWDTHVGQGAGSGYLANRLAELGQGLAAYADEMGPAWRDSTVVVISEFGRTFRENGNRGTDHGHGTVYTLLGGGVHGGRIVGEQVALAPDTLFQHRDYPVLNEVRALLSGLFKRVYGLSPAQLQQVFPGAVAQDLGLV